MLRYAGFWPRLWASLLDTVVLLPITAIYAWGSERYRLFDLYSLAPDIALFLFYNVYLVKRFGGTPGKLVAGIRILKVDGESVGIREALLRCSVDLIFALLTSIGMLVAIFRMSDAEFHSLQFVERAVRLQELAPYWSNVTYWFLEIWVWGELVVLLTNKKRRAIHDFIAGTVVVYKPSFVRLPQTVTVTLE